MSAASPFTPELWGPICYRFCDVLLALRATRAEVLNAFERRYGTLRESLTGQQFRTIECLIDTDRSGRGRLVIEGQERWVRLPDSQSEYAFALILDAVTAASCNFLYLHSATVIAEGQTALFVGPSGAGKSTLAQALVTKGAICLADDLTSLEVATGTVVPFPQTPQRDCTQEVVAALTARHVFLLGSPTVPIRLHLAVDHIPPLWRYSPPWALGASVVIHETRDYAEILAPKASVDLQVSISRSCEKSGVTILRDLSHVSPHFGETPRISALRPTEALPRLASNLFGRAKRQTTDLIWKLGTALSQAALWELTVGPPAVSAHAVMDLLAGSRSTT
ncbi:MAG: hypothetical protein ACUVX8_13415 [Candidatus Zipacnadales bacterium]